MNRAINSPMRVLLVEDSAADAELIIDQLQEAGIELRHDRVASATVLALALQSFEPDIVLSDLSMPGFSGYEALEQVRRALPELPFIFVSGTMTEATAVAALQRGANDYIFKQQPARLPSAVCRAVADARAARDQRRVEAELMRAQRLESLSLLAAGLSHDLRNVLQPLLIMPDLLKARTHDPALHHLVDVIAECGRRGHEMAESMLAFVRGSRTSTAGVPVGTLFQGVELLLRGSLPAGVQFDLQVADATAEVRGNFTELQQVLLNLALNAIQAMPDGGTLVLQSMPARASGHGEGLVICVRDDGEGMDGWTQARLFSPFFTTKLDGTGLGLMSCKRIVEQCGGHIQVESVLGQGSCFSLWLPVPAEGKASTLTAPGVVVLTDARTPVGALSCRHEVKAPLVEGGWPALRPPHNPREPSPIRMTTVLLSLGSNVQPRYYLDAAVKALRAHFGEVQVSPAYRTAAVGFDGPAFLNNAVQLQTALPLLELDSWLHALEDAHGRDRSGPRFSDRTLDIDVVFYGDLIVEGPGHLRIPRPELKHAFVLKPLADIAPAFTDPVSGLSLSALWQAHPQHGETFEIVPLGAPD